LESFGSLALKEEFEGKARTEVWNGWILNQGSLGSFKRDLLAI